LPCRACQRTRAQWPEAFAAESELIKLSTDMPAAAEAFAAEAFAAEAEPPEAESPEAESPEAESPEAESPEADASPCSIPSSDCWSLRS